MNFFIISLARIEPHSFAPLRPACFGALPSSRAWLRFVRRWRARRGPGPARPGRSRWRWGASSSRRRGGRFATRNLANFLRPLAPGRRTIRLLGCPSDSCQRGRSFWEPPSEGETCGETGAKVVRWQPAPAAVGEGTQGGFEGGILTPAHTHRSHLPPHHARACTHTHSLSLLSLAHHGSKCQPSFRGTASWHGAGALWSSLSSSPATLPSPNEVAPHSAFPTSLSRLDFFFFSFMTQLARLNSPTTGDSYRPGEVGRGEGRVN